MVDRDGLENRRWCKLSVGSNPTPSVFRLIAWGLAWIGDFTGGPPAASPARKTKPRRRGGMADAEDLKSSEGQPSCEFESRRRHTKSLARMRESQENQGFLGAGET